MRTASKKPWSVCYSPAVNRVRNALARVDTRLATDLPTAWDMGTTAGRRYAAISIERVAELVEARGETAPVCSDSLQRLGIEGAIVLRSSGVSISLEISQLNRTGLAAHVTGPTLLELCHRPMQQTGGGRVHQGLLLD